MGTTSIDREHDLFRKVIEGKVRKDLQKRIRDNSVYGLRGKNGKIRIPIKEIDIPYINFGLPTNGVGRGEGKPDTTIGKDPQKGSAGDSASEGTLVDIDLNYVLEVFKEELELPDLKPKDKTFENVEIKYIDIALSGPESLRHNRRTMKEAMKRSLASGEGIKLQYVPGCIDPIKIISVINTDRRYRQYKEVIIPSNNAVLFFARDGSGSMDQEKCDLISDVSWWIEAWIRRFYEKIDVCYFWHDVDAQEVDSEKFYKYRYGGGTACSSCLKLMAEQFENRFMPSKYNIYIFYFTDGENASQDNEVFVDLLKEKFGINDVNLFALTQVMCNEYTSSIKKHVEESFSNEKQKNISLASMGPELGSWESAWEISHLTKEEKGAEVKKVIKTHLGKRR